MFERQDEDIASAAIADGAIETGAAEATTSADLPEYGLFANAKITAADGSAMVTVPLRRGKLILETDEPLICAWAIDNAAGAIATEAKKHKP